MTTRTEQDGFGPLELPADALYGVQTQRAVVNFPVSGWTMPRAFIAALGAIKAACARANGEFGHLPPAVAEAIAFAADRIARGEHIDQFPVDVFQTGSGTSSNMNANEVIARLATQRLGAAVHPNDHVNFGQSSNDVIPTAIQVAAARLLADELLPTLLDLKLMLEHRAGEHLQTVKTGRTHLMDAMPVTLGQELLGWAAQVRSNIERLADTQRRVARLPLGGTAVGTGINADARLGPRVAELLSAEGSVAFESADNYFEGISAKDECVELSGQLNTLACTLMKIANDLRWMNSGPLAGLGEIELPALQPGSSIMPGKVNPVIPESVAMVCAQVMGQHLTVTIAGQSGNFQLNVMLPVLAHNLLSSLSLLTNVVRLLTTRALAGFTVRHARIEATLAQNPILVTALNARIGYEQGALIAKRAYREGRPVLDVAQEVTGLARDELAALLDPAKLTRGGAAGPGGG
ncbi:MAG: class II fumarate hydratase [Ahniella sp.]|nr:class II fumarate hydratase [Ahniella sp.]